MLYLSLISVGQLLIIGYLLHARDNSELVGVIDRLCQRVQAPEAAVAEHATREAAPSPPAVSMFEDEQFWETKEALAERLMLEEQRGAA